MNAGLTELLGYAATAWSLARVSVLRHDAAPRTPPTAPARPFQPGGKIVLGGVAKDNVDSYGCAGAAMSCACPLPEAVPRLRFC